MGDAAMRSSGRTRRDHGQLVAAAAAAADVEEARGKASACSRGATAVLRSATAGRRGSSARLVGLS